MLRKKNAVAMATMNHIIMEISLRGQSHITGHLFVWL